MKESQNTRGISFDLMQYLLHEHLEDSAATLINYKAEPIKTAGVSGNAIYHVVVAWSDPGSGASSRAELVLKHWRPVAKMKIC